jgi:hypothetical protein
MDAFKKKIESDKRDENESSHAPGLPGLDRKRPPLSLSLPFLSFSLLSLLLLYPLSLVLLESTNERNKEQEWHMKKTRSKLGERN